MKLPHSQVVRHQTLTLTCASSNLAEAAIFKFASLAQSVEHLTFNQRVWSSNLQRGTNLMEEYPSLVEGTGLENREVV